MAFRKRSFRGKRRSFSKGGRRGGMRQLRRYTMKRGGIRL